MLSRKQTTLIISRLHSLLFSLSHLVSVIVIISYRYLPKFQLTVIVIGWRQLKSYR